jgi:hypothetical protein
MQERGWPGIATAVAIVWILSNVLWLGVAGPIWQAARSTNPDPWIGFAGNVLGATVTLLAAIIAGIAAYKTIVPMQRQLRELVRQNQFTQYEKLSNRSRKLHDELALTLRVVRDLDEIEKALNATGLGSRENLSGAIDACRSSTRSLWEGGANVWGNEAVLILRKSFIDASVMAAPSGIADLSNKSAWTETKKIATDAGDLVKKRIKIELQTVAEEIAAIEPAILGREK